MTFDDGETLLALLPVAFAKRRTVDAGTFGIQPGSDPAAVMRAARRPSFSAVGAYRRWSADAEAAGFPVGGMAMLLGLTEKDLIVYTPRFFRARPKRRAGAIPLADIAQMTAIRSILTGRVVVLFNYGGIVELETMRTKRAQRFVARVHEQRAQIH